MAVTNVRHRPGCIKREFGGGGAAPRSPVATCLHQCISYQFTFRILQYVRQLVEKARSYAEARLHTFCNIHTCVLTARKNISATKPVAVNARGTHENTDSTCISGDHRIQMMVFFQRIIVMSR